ncbi:hypothetical protein RB614_15455 [Phytohabitans sp. ZYX-F-186]|uniref:Uncharacterized protein n=1 Tax=Phytohabitans maris TaxID=3071409 RepID=A0ABU0ZFS1_9ACTN|nr:hypothetical protein [Phytohabitans sp. ZYX-F-186]MDQ7905913.1 hypothetical protein [Phytohabitans sp. ZYX-F-186]
MTTDDQAGWHRRRRHAVTVHAAAEERRRAVEISQARALVADFVRRARARDLPTQPLVARAYSGRGRYRTGLRGWYLKADRSMAVAEDGTFHLLTVPASLRARLTGITLPGDDPPLVVGRGGKDGESVPLATLLERVLSSE